MHSRGSQKPIAVSPSEAARMLGVGRTLLYAELAAGSIPSFSIGRRRLIRVEALREWIAKREGAHKK
jgi:excisionase family DNA binding protein